MWIIDFDILNSAYSFKVVPMAIFWKHRKIEKKKDIDETQIANCDI